MTTRCLPVRHLTSQAHAAVAASAIANEITEKLGSNPGASLATLAAGLAGTTVCIETHTTQMTRAQPLKNSRVNQSISAETLRPSVGNAKAASAARAGRAS